MKNIIRSLLTKQITIGSIVVKASTAAAAMAAVVVVGGTAGAVAVNSVNTQNSSGAAHGSENIAVEATTAMPETELQEGGDHPDSENTVIPEISHEHHYKTEILSESTCTVQGEAEETCTECGYSYTYKLPLAAHKSGEWVETLKATETAEGLQERRCTNCGTLLATEVIAVIPHSNFKRKCIL